MATSFRFERSAPMASPWRRRRLCQLVSDAPTTVALSSVTAAGAIVDTGVRLPLGTQVTLHHPDAGTIAAEVSAVTTGGLGLRFAPGGAAAGFALAAIASDMTLG